MKQGYSSLSVSNSKDGIWFEWKGHGEVTKCKSGQSMQISQISFSTVKYKLVIAPNIRFF
jgi:hypothetical protein